MNFFFETTLKTDGAVSKEDLPQCSAGRNMLSLLFLVAFFTSWIHEFDFRKGENSEIDSANNDVSLQHFRHLIQEL